MIGLLGAACQSVSGPKSGPGIVEFTGPTMGTSYSVKMVSGQGRDPSSTPELEGAIRDLLARIDELMSTWNPESELSRLNRYRGDMPFVLAPETFEVLRWAIEIGERSEGALDVTVGPILDLWGFGPDGPDDALPSSEQLAATLRHVGFRLLELDAAASTVRKVDPDVECELSALVAGYAADRIWDLLAEAGLEDYLVDVGGEIRARGLNDAGIPWQVAIERPDVGVRAVERIMALSDQAITTSGDYRNFFEVDGRRLSHIVDPRTGRPVEHGVTSVTVVADLGVRADAWATALMVLGDEEGLAVAERYGLAAVFFVRAEDGTVVAKATSAFEEMTQG